MQSTKGARSCIKYPFVELEDYIIGLDTEVVEDQAGWNTKAPTTAIVQRRVVLLIGLPDSLAVEARIREKWMMGQYGTITDVSIVRRSGFKTMTMLEHAQNDKYGEKNPKASSWDPLRNQVYVTYETDLQAMIAILAISRLKNGVINKPRDVHEKLVKVMASLGTVRICSNHAMGSKNLKCRYLHEKPVDSSHFKISILGKTRKDSFAMVGDIIPSLIALKGRERIEELYSSMKSTVYDRTWNEFIFPVALSGLSWLLGVIDKNYEIDDELFTRYGALPYYVDDELTNTHSSKISRLTETDTSDKGDSLKVSREPSHDTRKPSTFSLQVSPACLSSSPPQQPPKPINQTHAVTTLQSVQPQAAKPIQIEQVPPTALVSQVLKRPVWPTFEREHFDLTNCRSHFLLEDMVQEYDNPALDSSESASRSLAHQLHEILRFEGAKTSDDWLSHLPSVRRFSRYSDHGICSLICNKKKQPKKLNQIIADEDYEEVKLLANLTRTFRDLEITTGSEFLSKRKAYKGADLPTPFLQSKFKKPQQIGNLVFPTDIFPPEICSEAVFWINIWNSRFGPKVYEYILKRRSPVSSFPTKIELSSPPFNPKDNSKSKKLNATVRPYTIED